MAVCRNGLWQRGAKLKVLQIEYLAGGYHGERGALKP